MRKKALLGIGMALFAGGTVAAQFASDRGPVGVPMGAAPTPLPPGLTPVTPAPFAPPPGAYPTPPAAPRTPTGGYVPPVGGLQPAAHLTPAAAPLTLPTNLEIKSALGADHPWLIKPEHGPYFIMVKSYVRPAPKDGKIEDGGLSARELGEGLASEIRDTYRVQAFLFEYVSEERKAEMRQIAAARQKALTYYTQLDALKQKAQLQGMEFLSPDNKLHIMTHHHRDQIGVLVGGFQTEADALKALTKLKTWPTPKNEVLCDKGTFVQIDEKGKPEVAKSAMNPYTGAFVVPNPAIARSTQPGAPRGLDPFVVKLNEDAPYNLLKATKGWTLAVKSFTAPVEISNKNSDTSLMRKAGLGKGGNVLLAGGEHAEGMAKMLRQLKGPGGQSLNLESFVLHTRNASLVTVGQFDGPDDPALHATKRLLAGITANVSEDKEGTRKVTNAPTLFDNMVAMPIPKP